MADEKLTVTKIVHLNLPGGGHYAPCGVKIGTSSMTEAISSSAHLEVIEMVTCVTCKIAMVAFVKAFNVATRRKTIDWIGLAKAVEKARLERNRAERERTKKDWLERKRKF